jgi:hypothetical protein
MVKGAIEVAASEANRKRLLSECKCGGYEIPTSNILGRKTAILHENYCKGEV